MVYLGNAKRGLEKLPRSGLVLLPVIRMRLTPVLLTLILVGLIIRIVTHLPPLPCRLSGSLTDRLAAVPGTLLPRIRNKIPPAMTTRHLFHNPTAIS